MNQRSIHCGNRHDPEDTADDIINSQESAVVQVRKSSSFLHLNLFFTTPRVFLKSKKNIVTSGFLCCFVAEQLGFSTSITAACCSQN